ncbi:HAD family hydrolase [Taibaiella chishuiensis]|uniref:phosphoglycolate phosphatase n=1 Tax=Taibaiella chishuiensis TaxID=1434707 RepID=A0A2P8D1L8_9BACT|nr:HAD family hydrolase [Taibaiella chishuiensis]PSK91130.1 phosphoglycolate phosphatase-like HAD superfamily hydrolase [Taibaiella chishuiensis]
MRPKKHLIVFDIDGTLTDSVTVHQAGFIAALKQLGVTEVSHNFHTYKHHTDLHIARCLYESALQQAFDATVISRFDTLLADYIVAAGLPAEIKGAKRFVTYLEQETDFGVCYATGSMHGPAVLKLRAAGIGFAPLQLAASNLYEERGAIVQAAIDNACTYYGVRSFDRIIAFGDGLWDLKTAQALGIGFVGIGPIHKTALEAAGMAVHWNDFEAFDPLFLN